MAKVHSSPYEILYKTVLDKREALETKIATITSKSFRGMGVSLPTLPSLEVARRPLLAKTKCSEQKTFMAELQRDLRVIEDDMDAIETYIRHVSYLQELEGAKLKWRAGVNILPFDRDDFDSVERALLDYRRQMALIRKEVQTRALKTRRQTLELRKSGELEKDFITTNHRRWRDPRLLRTKRPRDDSSEEDSSEHERWASEIYRARREIKLAEGIAMDQSVPWFMREDAILFLETGHTVSNV